LFGAALAGAADGAAALAGAADGGAARVLPNGLLTTLMI